MSNFSNRSNFFFDIGYDGSMGEWDSRYANRDGVEVSPVYTRHNSSKIALVIKIVFLY